MRKEKQAFRQMLRERGNLPDPTADATITRRILEHPLYQTAHCVLLYLSIGHEVDTCELIKYTLQSGKKLCVPRCHAGGGMDAVEIVNFDDLKIGMYGIQEPKQSLPPIDPCALDLVVVPGVAFDRSRNRLGRGAGYYDRFLARAEYAATMGICRAERLFDTIPCEPHDRKMDVLLTEYEIIQKDDAE